MNYIFDFGNVLAEYDPYKLTSPFVEDESMRKTISEIVFDRLYWNKLDRGTITDDELKEQILPRIPEGFYDVACKAYDCWVENLTPVANMQQLVYDIHKKGDKLYLLSNISIGFAESYSKVDWIRELLDCFDGMVFSGVVGMAKPEKDIFEHLLQKFNLKAEDCLFVDDSAKNIAGAKAVGIDGYLFDGDGAKLRSFLGL